jgi:hypothetical protein
LIVSGYAAPAAIGHEDGGGQPGDAPGEPDTICRVGRTKEPFRS